jgi:hypothetical protein
LIEKDTVRLLRECSSGVRMGVDSIEDVLKYVESQPLHKLLSDCRDRHEVLGRETDNQLKRFGDEGKSPNPIAKGMSWMKTEVMLSMKDSDHTIADLITDGCNMGVKSLSKYLNQYAAADESSKDIAKRLISLEDRLAEDMRAWL